MLEVRSLNETVSNQCKLKFSRRYGSVAISRKAMLRRKVPVVEHTNGAIAP